MDPIFYKKISGKLRFCFQKKFEIFEIQNINDIPSFTISFLFFLAFLAFFFSISPIQTCPKIMEFFVVFYSKN